MAAVDGTTSTRRGYRRRLAAAAVVSVALHLVLARGLALTSLGLDGRSADAAPAAKPAPKPKKDFSLRAPRADAPRPAHERPLTITATPRAAGRTASERPATRTAVGPRPDEPPEAVTAPVPAPARERDLEIGRGAAPGRSAPTAAATSTAAALAADTTAPAEVDATPEPAALARDRDGPASAATRWRPREVALLERLIAPAPPQPVADRDDAATDGPARAATADDAAQRRPIAVTGPTSAAAPSDTSAPAPMAAADTAVSGPGPGQPRTTPSLGAAARGGASRDVAADEGPAAGPPLPGSRPSPIRAAPDGDDDASTGRSTPGRVRGPERVPVVAGDGPGAAVAAAAGADGAVGPATETSAGAGYGPRAIGRAAGTDRDPRLAAARPGIGRAGFGPADDDGEEDDGAQLSVPRTSRAGGGPGRDDEDDVPATAAPRTPERLAVVALPPESRARDVSEAFRQRGRDARAPRRSDPRVRRADEVIDRGLDFLARAQQADGRWSLGRFAGSGPADVPELTSDTAATGLALLAFLGAGHDHFGGPHREAVRRGLEFLLAVQKPDGDLYLPADELSNSCARLYSHGIASIALCEAVGMTGDPLVRPAAAKACSFVAASQHPELGGWRYLPRSDADLSVSGWMLVALRSGALAGVETDPRALAGVRTLLEAAATADDPARYAYNPRKPDQRSNPASGLCMTAVGALMRLHTGARVDDPRVTAAARVLAARRPSLDDRDRDSYLWYYASQVLVHTGGADWDAWYAALLDTLSGRQETAGGRAGSWDPLGPRPDRWGRWGGRVYVTALHLLALEVPDRRLPTSAVGP